MSRPSMERLRELFGLYDKEYFGNKAGACAVLGTSKGNEDWKPGNGCHGAAVSLEYTECIYSSLWCRYEELYEAACDYWDYLLDPARSPYRLALKGVERVYNKDGRPIAFGFTDTYVVSAQLAFGLMMQCRVPQEYSNKLRSYWHWRKSGFEAWESLYLSEYMVLRKDGLLSPISNDYYHGFNYSLNNNIKWIKDGTPRIGDNMLSSLKYRPVAAVWAPYNSCYEESKDKKKVVVSLVKGPLKYKGAFPALFKKKNGDKLTLEGEGIIDKHEAAKVLKSRRREWSVV